MPLEAFKQSYCNNDLSGLIITGKPSLEILHNAFNEILFEYSGLFKTEGSDFTFNLSKEIGVLEHHIVYVEYATTYLKLQYNEDFAQELRLMGYTLEEGENYQEQIELIRSLSITKVFELDNLRDEYNRLSKTSEGKKQTEEEFEKTIAILSKFQGYNLDSFTTTVYRFVMIFNNYVSQISANEKK